MTPSDIVRLGEQARFRHFLRLKSGRDKYSKMKASQLLELVTVPVITPFDKEEDVAKVLRWVLRGLTPELAIRKVKVDLEVSGHAKHAAEERRIQEWEQDEYNHEDQP